MHAGRGRVMHAGRGRVMHWIRPCITSTMHIHTCMSRTSHAARTSHACRPRTSHALDQTMHDERYAYTSRTSHVSVQTMHDVRQLVTRQHRLCIVVFCSGGSQGVDRWEVDNAFITLQGGQPATATSTILAIIHCSSFAAPRTAAALVYCMLPRPPLCIALYDYVSQWILFLGLVLDLPVPYHRYSNRSSSDR